MKKRSKFDFLKQPFKWLDQHNWHKHPFVIPVATLFVLFFAVLAFFIFSGGTQITASDSHLVVFTHDKKQRTLPTRAQTVGEFLERVDVHLNEGDVVEPSTDTKITDEKFRINVYRARPVTVIDGERKTFALSAATTPRSVATQVGVQVHPEDRVESKMETEFLRDSTIGEKVVINRATPVNLNLYGTPIPVRTHAKTVGELLKEKKVEVVNSDQVTPSANTPISPQIQIFVVKEGSTITTQEEEIPMEIETIEDASLSFGSTAIRQKGAPGRRVVAYQHDLDNNGNVIGRKEIQSVIVQAPVKQIVVRGKTVYIPADKEAVMRAAGVPSSDFKYVYSIVGRESGWNAAARNRSSGAFGLCQALPGSKMASAGSDWASNPVTQLRWCDGYAKDRYGSWAAAHNFWQANRWW